MSGWIINSYSLNAIIAPRNVERRPLIAFRKYFPNLIKLFSEAEHFANIILSPPPQQLDYDCTRSGEMIARG